MKEPSVKMKEIQYRQSQVNQYLIKGYSQAEIAKLLQVSEPTISRDVDVLEAQANESIKKHLDKTLPYQYSKCLQGLENIIREAYKIMDTTDENRERLSALSLIKETYSTKMDLLTNANLLQDSIKFVDSHKQKQGDNNDLEGPSEVNTVF